MAPQLADMPWAENAIGLVVYAAGPRGGQPLVEAGPISNFPIKEVKIPPRGSVSGTINISRLFPALSRYSRYDDLMLFRGYNRIVPVDDASDRSEMDSEVGDNQQMLRC